MKNLLLGLILIYPILLTGQSEKGNVVLNFDKKQTSVSTNTQGALIINVSPKDVTKFKARGVVRYGDFGAKGNGKVDDINSIAATHAFANENDLPVKADERASYYISGQERTVIIKTDTDFGTASFIVDDTKVQNRNAPIFIVSSNLKSFKVEGVSKLKKHQKKIKATLQTACLITVTDKTTNRYIRKGLNQNNGKAQTDIFVVDKNGKLDKNTPIIWDFNSISDITALPIDKTTLKITGGRFTTIANQAESKYNYHQRNIIIRRSNVIVDGLEHRITGEGDHGAPYRGFITIEDCANVTVRNTTLTGHKTYRTIGAAGKPVSMGSYDLSVRRALNVSIINCKQTNDINDQTYWGIMASNYSKNILYDSCVFSRFDAHMGVANATIKNSTLGHMGINAIGSGILTLENSTIHGRTLINLRQDYGSTWQGKFIIRNCTFAPAHSSNQLSLIGGYNDGQHDFGYTCYMPERITIENLHIDDSKLPETYQGPNIFFNFNVDKTSDSYQEPFPYIITKKVIMNNVTIKSGKSLRRSDNEYLFKNVKLISN
ncbi:MAG: hypothetical protein AAFO07_01785 [Bacteroidota bacterium]